MSSTVLREYQKTIKTQVFNAWDNGIKNVLVQSHTGSGKTVLLTDIVETANVPTVIIAHRLELVSQLSLAVARAEIPHALIAPAASIAEIIKLHLHNGPRHYFSPTSQVIVASVDTLIRRDPQWCERVKLVVVDEAAHLLRANKWGTACAMFPNARTLLVTATPLRADGRGLGSEAQGIADILIEGPSMRQLISEGYLSEYRIFAPPNNLDLSPVTVTSSGDYSPKPLSDAVSKARITGDIVEHYLRHDGGLGITFAVSVEAAKELAAAYETAGVPAVCLHAETGISERASVMRRFREGAIRQLVNVDILAEGVDVPAVSCVSLARPTASYALHMQQIGRALRPAEGKPYAVILDHVGNVTKHGLPDEPRIWTLQAQDKKARGKSGTIPLRTCLNPICVAVFPRNLDRCTYCKHPVPLPKERARPDQVDGNLRELTTEALKTITDKIKRIEGAPRVPYGVSGIIVSSILKKHHAKQDAQKVLRDVIAEWAGVWHAKGESDTEILRRFWFQFGIDTLTAQTLPTAEALALIEKIAPDNEFVKKNEIIEVYRNGRPKLKNKLTKEDIEKAVIKKTKYGMSDGGSLSLMIFPSGKKTWRLDYTLNHVQKTRNLGPYPEISLKKAREFRDKAHLLVKKGKDPDISKKTRIPLSTLSETEIDNAKQKEKNYILNDGGGLLLKISKAGTKYWVVEYRYKNKRKVLGLGRYPVINLTDARTLREKIENSIRNCVDPATILLSD